MRARADADLFFFCREVLGLTLLEDEPHRRLCRWLQRPARMRKKLVLMPRGSFKSSIISFGYCLWRLLQDPARRVLLDSDLRANAKKFAGLMRQHLAGNARLRQLYGDLVAESGWTEDFFTVTRGVYHKEPSVMTSGMDQVVVSLHFDLIVGTDLVNNTNISTREALEKTSDHIRLLMPLLELPEINPDAELILEGTCWDDQDAYSQLMRASGLGEDAIEDVLADGEAQIGEWDVFFRSAYRRVDEDGRVRYVAEEGDPLFSLFTLAFLEQQKSASNLGSYWFAANYLNRPVPAGDATFRREWFRYWNPPLPEGLDVVMTVDPALSLKKHGDYSAIVCGGATIGKHLYLFKAWKKRVNPHDLVAEIYATYDAYRPRAVGVETVAFQKALRFMLEDAAAQYGFWLPIVELQPDTRESKEMRIRSIQPLYQDSMIYHTREMGDLEMEELKWRATRKAQPDDLTDALAYLRIMLAPARKDKKAGPPAQPENPVTGY